MNIRDLKDKALRTALPLLATSMVGRMLVDRGLAMAAQQLGLPICGDYVKEKELWLIRIGEPGAPLRGEFEVSNDSLSALLEELVPDLVQERPISRERVLDLLRQHMTAGKD